jgi:hypothetical protein
MTPRSNVSSGAAITTVKPSGLSAISKTRCRLKDACDTVRKGRRRRQYVGKDESQVQLCGDRREHVELGREPESDEDLANQPAGLPLGRQCALEVPRQKFPGLYQSGP